MTPVRLEAAFLPPLEPSNLYGHLVATAVPGVEEWRHGAYRAAVRLPGGPAILAVAPPLGGTVRIEAHLSDPSDREEAVRRVRRLLDLDADPVRTGSVLARDPVLAPLVAAVPGRRVPGALDPEAMAVKAVLGQQVSTLAARTHAARLVEAFGTPLRDPSGGLTALFPTAGALAADPAGLAAVARMPATRQRTLRALVEALTTRTVDLDEPDVPSVRAALGALPGVGPWTVETIAMRALGDPDAFVGTDLGVVQAARRLGLPERPSALERASRAWSPFRATAVQYLWATGTHPVNALPS